MYDIRVKDLNESTVPGADYYLLTDSATDGVKKVKTTNVVKPADIGAASLTGAETLTNKTISGASNTLTNIPNAALTNSGVTISGTAVPLGGSKNLAPADLGTMADSTILSNISGGVAAPSANTISVVLDKLFGSTQGSVVYRALTGWAALAPGVIGQYFKTQGAGNNPMWDTPAGGGDMLKALYDPGAVNASVFDLANIATFTRAQFAAKSIPAAQVAVTTNGYATAGDGGAASYIRVSAPGTVKPWHFQSADGAWWELEERSPSPAMFGGDATGVAGSSTAITNAVSYVVAKWGKGFIDCRGKWKLDTGTITITDNDVVLGGVGSFGQAEFVRGHDAGPLFAFQSPTPATAYGAVRSGLVHAFIYDNAALGTFANSPFGVVFDLANYPIFENICTSDECVAFRSCANVMMHDLRITHFDKTYAAGRHLLYLGPSTLLSAFIQNGGTTYITNLELVGGTIVGSSVQPKVDECLYVETIDGLHIANGHAAGSAVANLRIRRTSATAPCDNIEFANFFSDIGVGTTIQIDGTQIVNNFKYHGTASQVGLGSVSTDSVSITGPCERVTLDINVEGTKRHGIFVNHAGVARLTIRTGHIFNTDSDNTGDGDGIYIQACASASIVGGMIGGDGKMENGIHLGSGAQNVMVSGVKASDCNGWGCIVDSGATGFSIIGNDFAGNTLGALSDGTPTSTAKLIKDNRGTIIYGSQVQTIGTLVAGVTAFWNVTATGAAYGDRVKVSFDKDIGACMEGAHVTGPSTVRVKIFNGTGASVVLGDVVAYVEVEKRYSA